MQKSKNKTLLVVTCIVALLLITAGGVLWLLPKQASVKKQYNILMISVDTLRADHLSLYGYPKNTTPNISAWAKHDGVIMANAYTHIPLTYPSFASTMTGLSPFQTSIYNYGVITKNAQGVYYVKETDGSSRIPNDKPTLAEQLKKDDYTSAAFVINSSLRAGSTHLNRGFDTYNVTLDNYQMDRGVGGVVDDGLSWIDTHKNTSRPFFLWMHFLDPHDPFTPTVEDECKFASQYCSDIKKNGIKYYLSQETSLQGCQMSPLPDKIVAIQEALYDAELYETDQYVGQILSYVKKNDLDKNTIIVFYSDHGEGFDHDYYFNHGNELYESSVKVPFIISTPDTLGKSHTVSQLYDNTKTMPLLLSLINRKSSIDNVMSSQSMQDDDIYYVNSSKNKFALREGNMKYLYMTLSPGLICAAKQQEELYDLSTDPQEQHNLISAKPDLALRLKQKLLKYIQNSALRINNSSHEPVPTPTVISNTHEQQMFLDLRKLGY